MKTATLALLLSLVAAVPFLAVAPTLSGWTFVAVLSLGGFLLQSTLPVNVTFGQMIALARHSIEAHGAVANNRWSDYRGFIGTELAGKTLGVHAVEDRGDGSEQHHGPAEMWTT